MADPLRDEIASQYEQWSYPVAVDDIAAATRTARHMLDPAISHRSFWPDRDYRPDMDILVAGCGTREAAEIAFYNKGARVVGIDVSEASLAHQRRLKEKHSLAGLELKQLAIEDAPSLGRQFDLIICTGVLHHTADPRRSLRALGQCLKRDGTVAVMVYARYGRLGVEMLRDLFRTLGLKQDSASIEVVKDALKCLTPAHPVDIEKTRKAFDFHNDAGVVDMFLNARDTSYSVAEVLSLVADSGLAFQDWLINFRYYPDAHLKDRATPFARAILALEPPAAWVATELFYPVPNARHFFCACRADRPRGSYAIDFGSSDARGYRPERRGVVTFTPASGPAAEEAATLGNEVTTCRIDAPRAALFNAMDGQKTISEIIVAAGAADRTMPDYFSGPRFALDFFRFLWRAGFISVRLPPA